MSCRGKRCTVWSEVLSPLSIRSTSIRPMTPRQRTQCAFESEVLISSKIPSSFRTDFGSTQRTGLELIKTEHWLFYSASRPWLPEPPSRCSCERFCPRKNSPRNTHRGKQHPKGLPIDARGRMLVIQHRDCARTQSDGPCDNASAYSDR